jgi:hypothetical protein
MHITNYHLQKQVALLIRCGFRFINIQYIQRYIWMWNMSIINNNIYMGNREI